MSTMLAISGFSLDVQRAKCSGILSQARYPPSLPIVLCSPGAPSDSYLHLLPSPPAWVRLSPDESEEQAGQVQGGSRQSRRRCGKEPQVEFRVHLLASLSVESSSWAWALGIYLDPPLASVPPSGTCSHMWPQL